MPVLTMRSNVLGPRLETRLHHVFVRPNTTRLPQRSRLRTGFLPCALQQTESEEVILVQNCLLHDLYSDRPAANL